MKLTEAERILVGQIVNIKMEEATLREHLVLEEVYKLVDVDKIKYPVPPHFVPEEHQGLFKEYEGKKIADIEDEEAKAILQTAVRDSQAAEQKLWKNEQENLSDVNLNKEQVAALKRFYDKDQRPFPRHYHEAILSLHNKLESKKK